MSKNLDFNTGFTINSHPLGRKLTHTNLKNRSYNCLTVSITQALRHTHRTSFRTQPKVTMHSKNDQNLLLDNE